MAAQKLLSAVVRLDQRRQRYGAGHVIDILLGNRTPRVTQLEHTTLTVFGIGTELDDGEWRGVVRQLLAQRLLAVGDGYGTLALTEESGDGAARRPHRRAASGGPPGSDVAQREARAAKKVPGRRHGRAGRVGRGAVRAAARLAAATVAKEAGLPAYVIFHDATLRQVAADGAGVAGRPGGHLGGRRQQAGPLGSGRARGRRRLSSAQVEAVRSSCRWWAPIPQLNRWGGVWRSSG